MRTLPLLVSLLFCSSSALADPGDTPDATTPTEAAALLAEGLQQFNAANYEAALQAFARGYELEQRPDFLFAMGQTERLSGDCPSALTFYQQFLRTGPAKLHADLARQMIHKCKVALGSSPEVAELEESPPEETEHRGRARAPASSRTVIDYRPWHRDTIGVSLLGTGAASLLAGGALMMLASSSSSDAERAPSYQEHSRLLDQAKKQQIYGMVGLTAGSALLTSSALYYVFRDEPARVEHVTVSAADDHVSASFRLSF